MIADLSNPAEVEKWNLVWWGKHTSDGGLLTGEVPIDRVCPNVGHGLGRIKWCPLPVSKVIRVACDNEAGLARLLKGDYSSTPTVSVPPTRQKPVTPVAAPVPSPAPAATGEPEEPDFDLFDEPEPPAPVPVPEVDDDDDWIT